MSGDGAAAPLAGLRVVEVSSFVAAPTAGLVLRQLGAEVVRVDPPGGAADIDRAPLAPSGASLFWAGMNRGKQSVTLDLTSADGRAALLDLVVESGPSGAILVSNAVGRAAIADAELRAHRPDAVYVQVLGRPDGRQAVDHVVNAWTGLPLLTGAPDLAGPVNHVLPAWDIACGLYTATTVLAGVCQRLETGVGLHASIALEDVALSTMTTLGFLSEVMVTGRERPRYGNFLYGSFGVDLDLADGSRVMVVALSERQWAALIDATGVTALITALAEHLDVDFTLNSARFEHREVIAGLLRPWFRARSLAEVTDEFTGTGVLWSAYGTVSDLVAAMRAGELPIAYECDDVSTGPHAATAGPIRVTGVTPARAPAPALGEHTDQVLEELRSTGGETGSRS